MNERELKVTYIDPNGRALFVAQDADGNFCVWVQKGDKPAQRLRAATALGNNSWATEAEAQNKLDCYVSVKRQEGSSWARWDVLVNGKYLDRFDDLSAIRSGNMPVPVAPAAFSPVQLKNIEYRIHTHMRAACENLLEVGRCLNEAKDAELVPHGQWEQWVQQQTGMRERTAQRIMQAARSVPSDSRMNALPITKIQTILALPEAEREPMAERAVSEGMSLRALQDAVKLEKKRAEKAEKELESLKEDIPKLAEAMANECADSMQREMEALYDDRLKRECAALHKQLDEAQAAANSSATAEAQAEIERLQGELADAENYAEQQNRLCQQAQMALAQQKLSDVRGGEGENEERFRLRAEELAMAVRTFIGIVGVYPHLGTELSMLTETERSEMRGYIDMVDTWVQGARQAMDTMIVIVEDGERHG